MCSYESRPRYARMARWTVLSTIMMVLGASPSLRAQDAVDGAESGAESGTEESAELGEAISVALSTTWTNKYFFRGILQEDQGVILQPAAEFTFSLYQGTGAIQEFAVNLGTWNSLHDGPSGSGGPNVTPRVWYESDFCAGIGLTLFDHWSVGAMYTAYMSPNDAFGTVDEISINVCYDDSHLWESWGVDIAGFSGLQPHATFAFELDGQADGGFDEGTYLELGIEPSFTLIDDADYPVTLSIPVTLGLSLGDYYEDGAGGDDTFGYFQAGVVASVPLAFMPARLGAWEMSVGVNALFLGDHTEAINVGDDFEILVGAGLSVSF